MVGMRMREDDQIDVGDPPGVEIGVSAVMILVDGKWLLDNGIKVPFGDIDAIEAVIGESSFLIGLSAQRLALYDRFGAGGYMAMAVMALAVTAEDFIPLMFGEKWNGAMGVYRCFLLMGVIQTYIIFDGSLSSWWTKIVIGLLLFGFIVLQKLLSRRTALTTAARSTAHG